MIRHALIVEDRHDTRQWLAGILARALPGIAIETAATLHMARQRLAARNDWRLVLLDIGLPDGSGIELIRDLREQHPKTEAIVTTIYDDDENLFNALSAGAHGYLLKSQPAELLVRHLQMLDDGVPPMSPGIARRMLAWFRERATAPLPASVDNSDVQLTARDIEVLSCIGRGLRVSETARHLGLSEHTVASYIKLLYRKLGINSRAQAALEATRRGLLDQGAR